MAGGQYNVDFSELEKSEKFTSNGYVPSCTAKSVANHNPVCAGKKVGDAIGKSGMTIGTGVDLGQMNEADLKKLKLPQALHDTLKPYLGKRGADAHDLPKLSLKASEAKLISNKVKDKIIGGIMDKYEHDSGKKFNSLSKDTQTAIVDYFYQFGPGAMKKGAHADFWKHITTDEWGKATEFLESQDNYQDRRTRESQLIKRSDEYKK